MYIRHFYYTAYDCVIEYIDFLPYRRSNLTLHNFYSMTKYFYATWKKVRRDIAKYLTPTRECTATHIYIHIISLRTNVLLNASISLHITYCKLNLILHNFMTRYLFFILRNIGFAFLLLRRRDYSLHLRSSFMRELFSVQNTMCRLHDRFKIFRNNCAIRVQIVREVFPLL